MSFIRPEAQVIVARWRDVIIGGVMMACALVIGAGAAGLVWIMAALLFLLGAGLAVTGWQRARIASRGGAGVAPGLVELDERQLSYLAGEGGAIVVLSEVNRIEIEIAPPPEGAAAGDMIWVFRRMGHPPARIPADALGADRLIDALAGFSGASYENVIRASRSPAPEQGKAHFLIWQRPLPTAPLVRPTLH